MADYSSVEKEGVEGGVHARKSITMGRPTAIDLYCGKGGWSHGLMAAGWQVIGFDIADMGGYPGELVLQDVLTIHGSQFRNAGLIVASPPCTEYSYMAMPFRRGKQIAAALRGEGAFPEPYTGSRTVEQLNALFNACFRIQREACEAAGRYIPMVVENVKGAQPWVGAAKANYGSFYLWGDVGMANGLIVSGRLEFGNVLKRGAAVKVPGQDWNRFRLHGEVSPDWKMQGGSFQSAAVADGVKQRGSGAEWFDRGIASLSSRSAARKEASARIAMIPYELARHVGETFRGDAVNVGRDQ